MSVDSTVYKYVLTRPTVNTPKPSSQPSDDTLSYLIYTPITASSSALSPSATSDSALTSSFKRRKMKESIQEGVKNIFS